MRHGWLVLAIIPLVAACGEGKRGSSGGSPIGSQTCVVSEAAAGVPGLPAALDRAGYLILVSHEATQTRAEGRVVVAAAAADSSGSGGSTAGGDTSTTINNFCGKDQVGPGGTKVTTTTTTSGP